MKPCRACGLPVAFSALLCPGCGCRDPHPGKMSCAIIFLILTALFIGGVLLVVLL